VIESPDFGSGHSVTVSDVGFEHIEAVLEHNLKMGITATRVGMYHSHPKLGVFMSSVDISTNRTGQLSDQHVSIVVDSVESVETGRLEIAAFRRCCALPLHPFPHSNCSTRCSYSILHPQSCPNPPPPPKEEAVDAFAVDPLEESQGARSHAWFIFFSLATARLLHISAGNGLGLGGLKLYRLGHQKSASDRENPHSEGLAFYKNGGVASSAGGYYRLKMGICKSATESEASMQVLSGFCYKKTLLHDQSCHSCIFFCRPSSCHCGAQMLPESWITPLLASPLIDSSVLAVKSTEEAAKKIAASSSARASFEALSGSESEMTRAACNCAALIAFQDRCMVIDKVTSRICFCFAFLVLIFLQI